MTNEEKMSWITSIEYCADRIAKELGDGVVESALAYYGAKCIDDLRPSQYSEVFNALSAIEADMD